MSKDGDCLRCDEVQKRAALAAGGFNEYEAYLSRLMILCPICGNKRCPKATWHENACTGSNEPGQPGSDFVGGVA